MAEITLPVESGRTTGSRASGRLRAAGKIPGVVYGHGIEPLPVAVEGRALRAALTTESGLNALLNLEVDTGGSHLTLARALQRHPVRHTVTHVDFQVVRRDEVISAEVPISLVGEAEAVHREDGVVEQQLFNLTVHATPALIPNVIEVDVSGLSVGDAIRVGDLPLPAGVSTDIDADQAVVVAQSATVEAAAPEGEGGPAGEGEGGAAQAEGGEG